MCTRMSMDIRVHDNPDQQNKQERLVVQPRTVVGPRPHENQLLQCFEFHDKHGRNRRKERICFDHELVRDQNKCVNCGDPSVYHEIQSIGLQLFRVNLSWA